MRFSIFSALAAFAFASPTDVIVPQCGNENLSPEVVAKNELEFQSIVQSLPDRLGEFSAIVDIYFHVIKETSDSDDISATRIKSQVDFLNHAYSSAGVQFNYISTDVTVNPSWAAVGYGTVEQTQMKETLRQGGVESLNVYLTSISGGSNGGTILGYATFPSRYDANPSDDGIVLNPIILTGGSSPGYDNGSILAHEIGHWMGLYHTFQGGCYGTGDLVSDTPAVDSAGRGCPVGRDSCPGGGVDLISNFMDYTDNSCMNSFTNGQIDRIQKQLASYRGFQ